MSTLELKQQLHRFIDEGDDAFVKIFFEMAKAYISQKKYDAMIAEGEEDVVMDRTFSLEETKKMLLKPKNG